MSQLCKKKKPAVSSWMEGEESNRKRKREGAEDGIDCVIRSAGEGGREEGGVECKPLHGERKRWVGRA